MSDEIIIQQLKDKEQQLLIELDKVRLALRAFVHGNLQFSGREPQNADYLKIEIPQVYDVNLTYSRKILYVLHEQQKPLLVEEIVQRLHEFEPGIDTNKLHKNVSYNLSMLAKYNHINKHPYNRKIKYSL